MHWVIYCDGSCRGNGTKDAVGAWAFVILQDDKIMGQFACPERNTTNQRMELSAFYYAMYAVSFMVKEGDTVEINTDSAYLCNCFSQKWYEKWEANGWVNSKRQPVANQDLWIKILPFIKNARARVQKCKGHSGDKWNEYVDKLAQEASAEELENVRDNNPSV